MKKLTLLSISLFFAFAAANVQAAHVTRWTPTSLDIQTINFSGLGLANFAIFANEEDLANNDIAAALDINDFAETIYVDISGGHIDLFTQNAGGTILDELHLGATGGTFVWGADLNGDGIFVSEYYYTEISDNSYLLSFSEGNLKASVTLAAIDVRPVPEPSTFLLLGLGIFGLFALRRRSNAS